MNKESIVFNCLNCGAALFKGEDLLDDERKIQQDGKIIFKKGMLGSLSSLHHLHPEEWMPVYCTSCNAEVGLGNRAGTQIWANRAALEREEKNPERSRRSRGAQGPAQMPPPLPPPPIPPYSYGYQGAQNAPPVQPMYYTGPAQMPPSPPPPAPPQMPATPPKKEPMRAGMAIVIALLMLLVVGASIGLTTYFTRDRNAPSANPTSTIAPQPEAESIEKLATRSIISDLREGSTGFEVGILQSKLWYFNLWGGPFDGIFSGKLEKAVKQFQAKYEGLKVDGIVGPMTRTFLNLGLDEALCPKTDQNEIDQIWQKIWEQELRIGSLEEGQNALRGETDALWDETRALWDEIYENCQPCQSTRTPRPAKTPRPTKTPHPHPTAYPTYHPTTEPTAYPTYQPTTEPDGVNVFVDSQFQEQSIDGMTFIITRFTFTGNRNLISQWSYKLNGTLQPWSAYQGGGSLETMFDRPNSIVSIQPVIKLLNGSLVWGNTRYWTPSDDPTAHPTYYPTTEPTAYPTYQPTTEPDGVNVFVDSQFQEQSIDGMTFIITRFTFTGNRNLISQWSYKLNGTLQPWSAYQGGGSLTAMIDRPHSMISIQPVIKLLNGSLVWGNTQSWTPND